ncbi:MAG: glycosyltransferase family 2 protein [Sulfurimonadaceae bacterium]
MSKKEFLTNKNHLPLVSIVTVVFNGKDALKKTIDSVINQTYKNIEYILIDGASTDGTTDIIKQYENQIDIRISEPDKGVYDAMNKGLKLASGEWVNFLNAGDTFFSNETINEIFNTKTQNEFKLIYGDWINVNNKGLKNYIKSLPYLNKRHLKRRLQMNHQSLFVKTKNIPNYDLTYKIKADYQWIIDIVQNLHGNEILYLPKPLVKYDLEGLSATALLQNMKEYIYLTKRNFGIMQVIKNSDIYAKYYIKYCISKIKNFVSV